MGIATLVLLTASSAAALQDAQIGAKADILELVESGEESGLVDAIRRDADEARKSLHRLLRLSVEAATAEERVRRLLQAERLAQAYLTAWSDSFLVHGVERFENWSRGERDDKLQADSVRLAGVEAFYREGPDAAMRLWQASLTQYQALADPAGQATALGNLGAGYYVQGELERALRYYTRSFELAEAAGDRRTQGNALGNIASVYKDQGEFVRAAEYYKRARETRPLTGDRRGEAADLNNLGLIQQALGDLESAERDFRRALDLNRSDGRDRPAGANLTNLANLAAITGDYDAALRFYQEALSVRRESGDRRGEALDLQNMGQLHLRRGDYAAALRSLEAALDIVSEVGPEIRGAEVRSDLAAVQTAMGHLDAALEELDQAEAAASDDEYFGPAVTLQRADLFVELGEYEAASELYRQAQLGYRQLEDVAGQAEALQGLAFLSQIRGDYSAAEEAYTRALLIQEALPDPRPAALTRTLLGDAQLLAGDSASARSSYGRALTTFQQLGDVVAEARVLGALANLDRELGSLDTAAATYRMALARLGRQPLHPVRWYLHLGLGLTLRDQGELDAAAEELNAAIANVDAVARSLTVEELRHGYLEDMWDVYAELALTEVARGRPGVAFQVSERMRARQLVDLLSHGRIRTDTLDAELVEREQTLRRQIAQLTQALDEPSERAKMRGNPEAERRISALQESLGRVQAEYRRLLVRLKRSQSRYVDLVEPPAVTLEEVRALLPDDAVLIEYMLHEDRILAFVLSKEDIAVRELYAGRKTVRQLIEFFRGTMTSPTTAGASRDVWRAPLRRLYDDLLGPLEAAGDLDGRRLLIIVPHAELHYLPFEALMRRTPAGGSFLIESFDVAYIPSAAVWLQLARRAPATRAGGLLALAPRPAVLAGSLDEVEAISRTDPRASVLVGAPATESAFRALASDQRIIHLATYGVLNPSNPLFSFVELRPDDEHDADGRLEVHEIFGLDLQADLVVLSACQTGLGRGYRRDVPPGDDWVGLVRAFLYAGAGAVVASLWSVEDRATAQLMARFYDGLRAGGPAVAALGDAQRAFVNKDELAHPFYWAGFILTGGVN
ncbi:MAG: CHAT domain-containing protein [Gemmatimonadales bacterium]|jgi:CHAT domain-containing protein